MMRYTKEIFDILSKGGFISQNSISQQRSHLYDPNLIKRKILKSLAFFAAADAATSAA